LSGFVVKVLLSDGDCEDLVTGNLAGNLGTFTTFTYGLRVPSVSNPPRFESHSISFWGFGVPLHLNRLSGEPDSNRRDYGNGVNVPMFPMFPNAGSTEKLPERSLRIIRLPNYQTMDYRGMGSGCRLVRDRFKRPHPDLYFDP
jgi:hypothetical protein